MDMKGFCGIFLLVLVLATGCSKTPKHIIEEDAMTRILVDMYKAEAVMEQEEKTFYNDSTKKRLRQSVFMKHNVTQELYDTSLIWYAHNLDVYKTICDEVVKELEAENKRLAGLKSEADSQMAALKAKQDESKKVLDEIMADIDQYEKALKAQEAAEAAAREEIRRLTMTSSGSQTTYSGGPFAWPSTSSYITSTYGTRVHPVTGQVKTHTGLDIGAASGTDIYAAAEGTVLVSGWNAGGYGNYVVIDHGGGLTTLYAHCSSLNVSAGQKVSRGQVIAKCGSTGMSTGPHLHFEVRQDGKAYNPRKEFPNYPDVPNK